MNSAPVSVVKPRMRLEYLDGIRGLASLVVLFCHACAMIVFLMDDGKRLGGTAETLLLFVLRTLLHYGHVAVCVFIALSGYCLMLPVLTSRTATTPEGRGKLPGGFWSYIGRRARRILPAYFFALLFASLVRMVPGVSVPGMLWISKWRAIPDAMDYISHILLFHNFRPDWNGQINMAFWSIAVEWQIYFIFPLVLLPIWRRFGNVGTLIIPFVLGVLAQRLLPYDPGVIYVAMFATGVVAAAINMGPSQATLNKSLYLAVAIIGFLAQAFLQLGQRASWKAHPVAKYVLLDTWGGSYPMDLFIGLATLGLLVYLTKTRQEGDTKHWALRFLESPGVTWLGAISYSLYLTHMPVLLLIARFCKPYAQPAWMFPLFLVGVAVSLGVTVVFHRFCEKPFLVTKPAAPQGVPQESKTPLQAVS